MDIIEEAEIVVGLYTMRRLTEALYSQKVCGCRACTARAMAWVDWAAADDDDGDDDWHVPQGAGARTSASPDDAALAPW